MIPYDCATRARFDSGSSLCVARLPADAVASPRWGCADRSREASIDDDSPRAHDGAHVDRLNGAHSHSSAFGRAGKCQPRDDICVSAEYDGGKVSEIWGGARPLDAPCEKSKWIAWRA